MKLIIKKKDITESDDVAIVNAANSELQAGGGVCGAIFSKAGKRELQEACNRIGGCKTGNAVLTPGFNLKSKYIIHAVGPVYRDESSNKYLSMAYYNSLKTANDNGVTSISFPSISTGIFGFPKQPAARLAFKAILDFFHDYPNATIEKITFCLIDQETFEIFENEAQFFPGYFDDEIVEVLDATRSFDFAVRPFYLMFLNGEINRDQLSHRLSLFGLPVTAMNNLPDNDFIEIIKSMDETIEKSLESFEKQPWWDNYPRTLNEFWKTKLAYPDGCWQPDRMTEELDLLYFGKPPVYYRMDGYYAFEPGMIYRSVYSFKIKGEPK
jgi:O-acetyl-ADP-ribose deacetylase (regulator of RNase III)